MLVVHDVFFDSSAPEPIDWDSGSRARSCNVLSIFSLVLRDRLSTSAAVRPLVEMRGRTVEVSVGRLVSIVDSQGAVGIEQTYP